MESMRLKADKQELINHGSKDFPIQYYVNSINKETGGVPLHWHPRAEFFTVYKGRVRVRVGSAEFTLNTGEGIFVNANTLHSYSQADSADCLCPDIVFSEELISPLNSAVNRLYVMPLIMDERLPFIRFTPDSGWKSGVLGLLDEVCALMQKYGKAGAYGEPEYVAYSHSPESACFEMEVQRALNRIWQEIYTHRDECATHSAIKNEHALQIRMQNMLAFINENYSRRITLRDIAQAANISKSEASRCFQSYLGTSPVNYLLDYRLQKAMQLLRSSEMTVNAIAIECCFGSSAYFCKIFRDRTGLTPMQYRKNE